MKISNVRLSGLCISLAFVGATLAGCPKQEPTPGEAPYGQAAPPPANTTPPVAGDTTPPGPKMGTKPDVVGSPGVAPPGPMSGGPMSGGPMMGGNPTAPLTPTPELDKAIKDAEAKGDKKTIAAAYASRGFSRMTDDNAGARVKYREALQDFRTALKNDPTNAKAKENKATIEGIYTSMGRPIPQ